ncbi:hypothetical protein [Microseira wollei]|uniref:Uncharacterized protein n=1 Tax=Microseira wollei NIES-4236 TaxID=2530354 RepID=A0AAV3XUH7_9CYAN|nr:hypothetical protein [Microseira wollei]GET44232.1 hypothetical protein MiSe_90580 [Microseira wollei NIES-4236]
MNPNQRKHSTQFEINDLIDDAVTNAMARRGFSEDLSDDEAASVAGGRLAVPEMAINDMMIAGYKPICPPPIKPICLPIDPVCPPIKPYPPQPCPPQPCPPKPCYPPVIAGLMYIPDKGAELA